MHGLIVKIVSADGSRDQLAELLMKSMADMPGCLSYIVAKDLADQDALWVTEVWTDAAAHAQSLSLPAVQELIVQAKPLIGSFAERLETKPLGGHGLASNRLQD